MPSTLFKACFFLSFCCLITYACFPPFVKDEKPYEPRYIRCYHCTGNYTYCALKNTINTCPFVTTMQHDVSEAANVLHPAQDQFQCVLAINFLDQSVYQGCASQCESDQSRFYKRSCSSYNLGNCFDIQCKHAVQDGAAFGSANFLSPWVLLLTLAIAITSLLV